MGLYAKSVWIFTLAFLAFALVFLFPSPILIGIAIIFVSCLAIVQTWVVLRDDSVEID